MKLIIKLCSQITVCVTIVLCRQIWILTLIPDSTTVRFNFRRITTNGSTTMFAEDTYV